MADALELAAERLAPSKATSNYLDPAAGQTVISRYANAGMRARDAALAREAADRLARSRDNRMSRQRDAVLWDREEVEHKEKQDFKAQRGQFLESIATIDPEADDFEDQLSTLYSSLPPSALEDDAVSAMIASKRQVAGDRAQVREREKFRQDAFEERKELMKMRYSNDPRLAALSQEERNGFIGEDGEFDFVGAGQLAYQKSRQNKTEDQIKVAETKRQWKIEDTADDQLDDESRKLKTLAKEHVLGDTTAFPNQVESLRKTLNAGKEKMISDKDLKASAGYEEARLYEARKFESELGSARNTKTADEYVAKGGEGLSEAQKNKRRQVWEAAQRGQAADAGIPATPAPAPAGAPPVGFESKGYVFTGGNPADKANWKKK